MAGIELRGEPAQLLAYGPTTFSIRASAAAPPGARLDAVAISDDGVRSAFRMKVHRCRKQEDGSFVLDGATIDLRREGREILVGLAQRVG